MQRERRRWSFIRLIRSDGPRAVCAIASGGGGRGHKARGRHRSGCIGRLDIRLGIGRVAAIVRSARPARRRTGPVAAAKMRTATSGRGKEKSEQREGGQETCHFEHSSLERGEVKGTVGYEFRKSRQEQVFWLKFWEMPAGESPDCKKDKPFPGKTGGMRGLSASGSPKIGKLPSRVLRKGPMAWYVSRNLITEGARRP
jgi:hypothetical protein